MSDIQIETASKPVPKFIPAAATPTPDAARGMTLFVMIVATLYFGKEVLVPITLALLLAFLLAPLVSLLRKLYFGRIPAVLLGVLFAFGVIIAIGGVIASQISELSADMPQYTSTIEGKVQTVQHYTLDRLTTFANHIGVKPAVINAQVGILPDPKAASPAAAHAQMPSPGSKPLELAQRYLSSVLSSLGTLFIVLVTAIFALLQQEDLRDRMIRLLGSDDLHRTTLAIDDGARRLSKYFLTQLSINSLFGVVIGLGLYAIGVPHPILFALLSALLRFVPYVGSAISALLPLSLAAAIDPDWSLMISTACLYLVVETVTGQLVEPMTYGHSTGLSPFSVIVAAIFWSWLWGPTGLILSTPLTLCLVVMGRHVKRLEFLDVMLGDRPALTPVESFYQRILAGDADEAQDQAELLLKDTTLVNYYDDVAIEGLQLAAGDAQRGALSSEQLIRVQDTIRALVEGLNGHEDKQPAPSLPDTNTILEPDERGRQIANTPPPPSAVPEGTPTAWSEGAPVMCVSGRGPLDEAAAAILGQLLQKHGIGSRQVAYGDAARERIAALDMTGVKMVCVACLDISGSPAHLRYLLRRLRHGLPQGTPILIGMWERADTAYEDPRARAQMGADYYHASMREALSYCLAEAHKAGEKIVPAAG